MRELTNEEKMEISGGASPGLIIVVVTGVITFISGILSGFSNPEKCH